MKKRLFQRLFERRSFEIPSRARRLTLEALENRELLNADWSGFAPEKTTEFSAPSAVYSIDLSESSANFCRLLDMNGDSVDELSTINYSSKTLNVYQNDNAGKYELKSTATIPEISANDATIVFGDVVGSDGIDDIVVVSQLYSESGLNLSATVYRGSSDYRFTKTTTTSLDVSKFGSALIFSSLDATLLANSSNGFDLVVQGETLSETGVSPRQTFVYAGVGTTDFGKTATNLNISGSATTDDPTVVASATIDGKEYVVSVDKTTPKSNGLVLVENGVATMKKYTYDLSSVGVVVVEWVLEQDGALVVGGSKGGASGILTINTTALNADGTATYNSNWTACDGLNLNASSCAAIGNMGGSKTTPEIFVANGGSYVVYQSALSEEYGFTFTQDSVVVSTPNYHSVFVGDYNGDGKSETILVGATQIWVADTKDDGSIENYRDVYTFDRTTKKAAFGDFNGDGKTDVVVYYQTEGYESTVGTNLQVFQQTSTGKFVPIASRSVAKFLDFAVGSFTQTASDEIAVLYTSGTSGEQFVQVLKLNVSTSSTALVSQRTFQLGQVGATALATGSLFGGGFDDLVTVNSSKDSITVLKNTGVTFAATTSSVNTSLIGTESYNPTAAAIGDINGDGKNDIVVLNSASGTNRGHLAYFLQTTDGFGKATSNTSLYLDGVAPSGLALADFNGDGKLDALTIQETSGGLFYLFTWLGDGTGFSSGKQYSQSTVGIAGNSALAVGKFNDDSSFDVALVQGKKLGVYLNVDATVAAGSVRFVCQSLSASAGADFDAALATERTWIDEWSNFYMDVWASTDGSGSVASVGAALQYNPANFNVAGIESAPGFTAEYLVENGVVTATATGTATGTGWTLVARIRFEPVSDGVYYVGGVDIPSDGVLASVASDFAVGTTQTVNGATAANVVAPSELALYPVNWDFNNDGKVNTTDYNAFLVYFDYETEMLPANAARYGIFDYNLDGKINTSDYNNYITYFDVAATNTVDSFYRLEPQVASNSSAVLDAAFAAAVLVETDDFGDFDDFDGASTGEIVDALAENVVVDNGATGKRDGAARRNFATFASFAKASTTNASPKTDDASSADDLELEADFVDFF